MTPEERKKQAEKNRQEMPNVAAMLDQIRKSNPELAFKVIGAEDLETGKKVGNI